MSARDLAERLFVALRGHPEPLSRIPDDAEFAAEAFDAAQAFEAEAKRREGSVSDAIAAGFAPVAAQAEEVAALRAFAIDVMGAWPIGDIDCFDLQNMAEKHGGKTRTAKA